jgi:hypothetical protein
MTGQPGTARDRSIPVTVEVPPALAARARQVDALAVVEERFRARLQRLGVPGAPSLRLHPGEPPRAVRVRVHQRPQPFSPELMEWVWRAVAPHRADVPQRQAGLSQAGFPDGWFTSFIEELGAAGGDGDWDLAVRFTGELAMEAVFEHPACLLGADQIGSLAGGAQPEDGPPPEELRQVLEELVEAGALPSAEAVTGALLGGARRHTPLRDTIESLAAAGRADRLEIQLPGRDFEALVPTGAGDRSLFLYKDPVPEGERGAFEQMERELFAALGLRLPALFVRRVDDLPAGMLRLAVNNLVTAPAPCPPPLTESVKRELRRQAGRLLGIEDVEYLLARLNGIFPELVAATLERVPLGELTRVLRALLEEGVGIRDLRAILERLLQYDTVPVDASRYRVLDDRLPVDPDSPPAPFPPWSWYLAFVRSGRGLQNHLSHAYRQGGAVATQVRAVKLPEQVEGLVREAAAGGGRRSGDGGTWEGAQSAVLAAVWKELSRVPARDAPIVLVVRDPLVRRLVRDHLAGELPDLPVVVRTELRSDIKILPADATQPAPDTPSPPPRPAGRRPRLHGRFFPPSPSGRP